MNILFYYTGLIFWSLVVASIFGIIGLILWWIIQATLITFFQVINVLRRKMPHNEWFNTPWEVWKTEFRYGEFIDLKKEFKKLFRPVTLWNPTKEKSKYSARVKE